MSDDLESSRDRLERSLADLRDALSTELGGVPKLGRWALVIAVAAAGFVIGGALGGRLSGRRRRRLLRDL